MTHNEELPPSTFENISKRSTFTFPGSGHSKTRTCFTALESARKFNDILWYVKAKDGNGKITTLKASRTQPVIIL